MVTITTKRITEVTYQVMVEDEREAIIKVMDFIQQSEAEGVEIVDSILIGENIEFSYSPDDEEEEVEPIDTMELDDPLGILDKEEDLEDFGNEVNDKRVLDAVQNVDEVQKLIEKEE